MKSIELFSGTGGLALGLQQAGFNHKALFEWDKDSCENIKRNIENGYPGVKDWSVYQTDVRTVNHAPGRSRSSMMTPFWDWFHPGRAWAANLQPFTKSKEQLDAEIREYLRNALL